MYMLKRKSAPYFFRAFTLIEMLVTVSIMTVILGITLSGGPQALLRLSLAEVTYSTELLLRESQLQGSAINSINGEIGGVGLFFTNSSTTNVVKFKDRIDPTIVHSIGIGNGIYDTTPVDELDMRHILLNKHRITRLCVSTGVDPFICNAEGALTINDLTVSFTRPSQTAFIYINNSTTTAYSAGCIQIDSIKAPLPGYVRSIMVYRSGMISKKIGPCTTP